MQLSLVSNPAAPPPPVAGVLPGQQQRVLQLMVDVGILREALRDAVWMLEQAQMHLAVRECAAMALDANGRAFVASLEARVAELRATLLTHGVVA